MVHIVRLLEWGVHGLLCKGIFKRHLHCCLSMKWVDYVLNDLFIRLYGIICDMERVGDSTMIIPNVQSLY